MNTNFYTINNNFWHYVIHVADKATWKKILDIETEPNNVTVKTVQPSFFLARLVFRLQGWIIKRFETTFSRKKQSLRELKERSM
jgi:hypothetical protein